MIICLVFLGKVPTYIRYCVQQIKEWSSLPLYLITDDIDNSKDMLIDYDINYVHSDDLKGELIDELEIQRKEFPTSNGLPGRENLFYYSFLRLFLVENLMRKYNISNVFHLEVDNLIYYDPNEFKSQFNSKGLSFIYENSGRGAAGIFYARDVESLNHLNKTTLTYINKGGWNSEMEFLGKYSDNYPEKIYFLPHCTPESTSLNNLSCNFNDFNKEWLFDPSSFGLWLTGIDICHSDGILSYRKNNWCPVDCTQYKYNWVIDDKGRRYIETITTSGHKCRIFNLHVHCKDLKPHMSKKFKIPSNRSLITDNSLIGISVKPENVDLIRKYSNRDNIYYNEGPMNINYSTFNKNPNDFTSYEEYIKDLLNNRFCICQTIEQILECVYLGVIPIVPYFPLVDNLKKIIKMVIVYNNNINLNYIPIPNLKETIYTEDFQIKKQYEETNIISGETFQSIKGVFSLYSKDSYNFRKPVPDFIVKAMIDDLNEDDWKRLHTSKIIQIVIELLPYFIENILPKLTHRFVLIGHNCDFGIDSKFIPMLNDDRIIHMFSQNTLIKHNKLTAIPIGIANSKYNHGKKDILCKAINTPINGESINRIYVNVDPGTNWNHRGCVLEHMRKNSLATFVNRSPYYEYLMQMKQYKWVCSPKGNGADCHRTWEALYVGCIPLVDNIDNFHEFAKELPIILIDDWSKVTLEFLEKETSKLKFNYEMLDFNYWKNKIENK